MRKRVKMDRRHSRRDFTRKAGAHPRNFQRGNPMRGGIRL